MTGGLPYNGWAESVRHGRDKHYYHARKKGVLHPASQCLGCNEPLNESCVPYHAEDYGPTLEDYWASCKPLCHRCHAMLHARFRTPNRWKEYLAQAAQGDIDTVQYPQGNQIAGLLSKYKNREDISYVEMPEQASEYLRTLPLVEYDGPTKAATLLVEDIESGNKVEVPDWTIYGVTLENLGKEGRRALEQRGVDVAAFLAGKVKLPVNKSGVPIYMRLYIK